MKRHHKGVLVKAGILKNVNSDLDDEIWIEVL